jgi:hypothetical protein
MKKLFLVLGFLGLVGAETKAHSQVSEAQALRAFEGLYKVTSDYFPEFNFVIDFKGRAKLDSDRDQTLTLNSTISTLSAVVGPPGLTLLTVVLVEGSDEDTNNLWLRIAPILKDGRLSLKFLDSVWTQNDGPNNSSFAEFEKSARLFKKINGKDVEIKR